MSQAEPQPPGGVGGALTFALLIGGVALIVILGVVAIASCGGEDGPPSEQIFVEGPWGNDAERISYDLTQRDDLLGTCVLETAPGGDTTLLTMECGDDEGNRDDRSATVETGTLRPLATDRYNLNVDQDDRELEWTADYEGDQVTISTRHNGDLENERTRDLPVTPDDPEDPVPGYYDDVTLFWLVRGIDLSLGVEYDKAFDDVNASGFQHIVDTRVTIEGEETVEVPAGEFETWRIRIQTSDITARFWVDQEEPHVVVRARLEDTEFELTAAE